MTKEEKVEIVILNKDNIEIEGIVCKRGEKNSEGISKKKEWLKTRFKEGLKFKVLKINGRSMGFIEYIPAEISWRPIEAPGYVLINCFWIIGGNKGKGYGSILLNECIKDAKNTNGIVILTSKKAWIPGKGFFQRKGFEVCDTAFQNDHKPIFELLVKKFKKAPNPKFKDNAKKGLMKDSNKVTFFYSDQCPYAAQHAKGSIECAKIYNLPFEIIKFADKTHSQKSFSPYESYCVFYKGRYLTHDLTPGVLAKKLDKIVNTSK